MNTLTTFKNIISHMATWQLIDLFEFNRRDDIYNKVSNELVVNELRKRKIEKFI